MHRTKRLTGGENTNPVMKNRMETGLLERSLFDLTRIEGIHPIIVAEVGWGRGRFEDLPTNQPFLLWLKKFAKWGSAAKFLEGR